MEAKEAEVVNPEVTPGSVWRHYNGGVYAVHGIANKDNPPDDDKPPTVVYMGANGQLWTRRLDDWHRSFKLMFDGTTKAGDYGRCDPNK